MESFLLYFAILMLVIAAAVVINEKTVRIPPEIALLIFSLILGIIFRVLINLSVIPPMNTIVENVSGVSIDELLMNVLLCFMLFSGASDLKFNMLKKQFKPIALLALLTTLVTAFIYGGLFYLVARLFGWNANFELCLLGGAIVSPTDPIAATGILNKMGLPKDVVAVMEGESLFNDGTGVALFVFVKGLVTGTSSMSFVPLMLHEIGGAVVIGMAISFGCSFLIKIVKNQVSHIIISLFAVSACYALCEIAGCSGVIASVVCGIFFATIVEDFKERKIISSDEHTYDSFWETIDKLLNYVLYVFIGMSFLFVVKVDYIILVSILAIVVNLVSRYGGVFVATVFSKKIPGGYTRGKFTALMTWSGLKGGLSLALIMSLAGELNQDTYEAMLFVVFGTILFTTIVQGLTVGKMYTKFIKTGE